MCISSCRLRCLYLHKMQIYSPQKNHLESHPCRWLCFLGASEFVHHVVLVGRSLVEGCFEGGSTVTRKVLPAVQMLLQG